MKKLITSFLLCALILLPVVTLAQSPATSTASTTNAQLEAQLAALRAQLLELLKRLQELLAQRLQDIQNNRPTTPTSPLSPMNPFNPLGSSGGGLLGGGSGLGGVITQAIFAELLKLNPTWSGSGDDSGTDYPVPGVSPVSGGPEGSYNVGPQTTPVPGKSTGDSQKIYSEAHQAASGAKPLTTSQYGRLGCAYATAEILKRAGLSVGDPDSLSYTPDLKRALDNAKGKINLVGKGRQAMVAAVPGDIIMSPTMNGRTGHVGVCMSTGCEKIASNSSSKQRFIINYTNINWALRFQENIYIYHAGAISAEQAKEAAGTSPSAPTGLGGTTPSKPVIYLYSPKDFVCGACLAEEQRLSQTNTVRVIHITDAQANAKGITLYPYISNTPLSF